MDFKYSFEFYLKWKWLVIATMVISVTKGDDPPASLVPAICIFGDSVVDVGNNNHLLTILKANFPPYGRDFVNHSPTGRFCNGKLAIDFIAEYLGFTSYQPAYLSQEASEKNILIGANFASAASGYYDVTSKLFGAISLTRQLDYYKEWQSKVTKLLGKKKATPMFSKTIHLLTAGNSDFLQNYYINPLLNRLYTPDQFSDILIRSYSTFIENLYGLGARRIGVTGLPPIGCLPAAVTLFGSGSNQCVERLNQDAVSFNNKLNNTSGSLRSKLHGLKLVVFDIYHPLLDIIKNPVDNGFSESSRACCGTGLLETSFLCNKRSVGTCTNATGYVFWDAFHPSESANMFLAGELAGQGFDLIS